jgi:hypothetical protein
LLILDFQVNIHKIVINGKDFIAHVDIPETVKIAFEKLKFVFGDKTGEANPLYYSK